MNAEVARSARLSSDSVYRYELRRVWNDGLPTVTFIMLNPSTADAMEDDPTIRRCIGFAQREGFGGLIVVNLFAFRATDPKVMARAIDPVGPENDTWTTRASHESPLVVAAWGANATPIRVKQVLRLTSDLQLKCFGTTKAGQPKHPLYLASDTSLTDWPAR